jgi:hypothetical protein
MQNLKCWLEGSSVDKRDNFIYYMFRVVIIFNPLLAKLKKDFLFPVGSIIEIKFNILESLC